MSHHVPIFEHNRQTGNVLLFSIQSSLWFFVPSCLSLWRFTDCNATTECIVFDNIGPALVMHMFSGPKIHQNHPAGNQQNFTDRFIFTRTPSQSPAAASWFREAARCALALATMQTEALNEAKFPFGKCESVWWQWPFRHEYVPYAPFIHTSMVCMRKRFNLQNVRMRRLDGHGSCATLSKFKSWVLTKRWLNHKTSICPLKTSILLGSKPKKCTTCATKPFH